MIILRRPVAPAVPWPAGEAPRSERGRGGVEKGTKSIRRTYVHKTVYMLTVGILARIVCYHTSYKRSRHVILIVVNIAEIDRLDEKAALSKRPTIHVYICIYIYIYMYRMHLIYVYIYIYICIHIVCKLYIYIYIEREREMRWFSTCVTHFHPSDRRAASH